MPLQSIYLQTIPVVAPQTPTCGSGESPATPSTDAELGRIGHGASLHAILPHTTIFCEKKKKCLEIQISV